MSVAKVRPSARRAVPRRSVKIEAIDIFCGAGGLAHGLQQAGIRLRAGVDVDESCRFAFEQNCKATFLQADVASVSGRDISRLYSGDSIRLLAGCAPCQPFSTYGQTRRSEDDRWRLIRSFLRLVLTCKPELVTMENVVRLALAPIWREFTNGLVRAGYHVAWGEIACEQFGIPQRRRRLVLMASRLGDISLPIPKPGASPTTVRSAIGILPAIRAGQTSKLDVLHAACSLSSLNKKRIQASRPGGTWRDWAPELRATCHRKKGGETYPSVYGRMSWDEPAPTITTQFYGYGNGRFGHPSQARAISIREAAILQTFPADYQFLPEGETPSFRKLGSLIGNAVPPKLAYAIGRAFKLHCLETLNP